MRLPAWIATGFLLVVSVSFGADGAAPTTLAECDLKVRLAPDAFDSYSCYWFVGRNQGLLDPAARQLEAMLEVDSDNPRIKLYLGILLADLGQARAVDFLEQAASGFRVEGNARGEVYARISLAINHGQRGHAGEANRELDTALARALDASDPDLEAQVRIHLAWRRYYAGEYGQAWGQLEQLQLVVFPDGSIYHRLDTLDAMAAVSWALGRHRAALDHYETMIELLHGSDPYRESTLRRNMALVAQSLAAEGRISDEELIALKRDALDAAIRGGNRLAEPGARLMLANTLSGEEGVEQARLGLAVAREFDKLGDTCWGLWLLAEKLQKLDPDHPGPAFALVEEAVELARSHGDAENLARGLVVRAKMRWKSGRRERAITESLEALDAIERIRDLQPEGESRARVFGRFADDYRWFAGALLEAPEGGPNDDDLARSFRVIERMRARSLLETLDATGATAALTPSTPLVEERAAVLEKIGEIRSQLGGSDLTKQKRGELLADLSLAEGAEASMRQELAHEFPRYAALRSEGLSSVREVQERLRPDQALLSYQTMHRLEDPGDDSRIGSWVLLVTRADAEAVPLLNCTGLDRRARLFLSLIERRDGSERAGAEQLYGDLLSGAVRRLPAEISSLIVIPDGPLHRLPLGALLDPADGRTLAERFEISVAPSAASWTRLARGSRRDASRPLLALADPTLPAGESDDGPRWRELLAIGHELAPLPGARREAQALNRHVGRGGKILAGDAASESALESAALSDFSMIHFAVHAIVNDEYPERSAVVLAADAEDDGLLGFRDVVDLELDGQVVVLSSCRSASGPLIGGEGVIGLANAFFQAGARTVVAGLWRVRDRETAALIDRFGLHLGQGESVAGAMTLARRELIREGAPAAAWAGMVVLGNGDLVPFVNPNDRARFWPRGLPLALALLLVVVVVVLVVRARALNADGAG